MIYPDSRVEPLQLLSQIVSKPLSNEEGNDKMLTQKQEALLVLLSASYGITQAGDAEAILAAYELALAQLPEQDVDAAFGLLTAGTAPGQNPSFMPPAPFVGALARNIRDGRLEREMRYRSAVKQIEDREIVKEGTVQTRSGIVAAALKRSGIHADERENTPGELAVAAEKSRAGQARHDEFFGVNERTDDEIRRALKI